MYPPDYIEVNRQNWNNVVDIHIQSDFYNNDAFLQGKSTLNEIELQLLGDISGKSILHLQCHFGQDTISLSRLGAAVTGVDLSDKAIASAKDFAAQTGSTAQFICCNIYDLPKHLHVQFDIVFTSYGTIGWLPDLQEWAKLIENYLKPGGHFIMAEFHPFVWAFDDDFTYIKYNYFNTGPIIETSTGTYADQSADLQSESVNWNHPTSEVLNSLINHGLQLKVFNEYDYSPYNCFQHTIEFEPGKFRITHFDNRFPMVYALDAIKQ